MLFLLAGCGRIGFDAHDDAGDDATPADALVIDVASLNISVVDMSPGTDATGPSVSVSMPVTAGNFLLAATYWNDPTSTVQVTDTLGHAWSSTAKASILSGCHPPGNGTNGEMFFAPVVTTGSDSITATQTVATAPLGMIVVQYSGIAAFSLSSTQVASVASNAMTVGPIAASDPGLVVAMFHDSVGSGTMGAGTGFSAIARDTTAYSMIEQEIVEPGSYSADGTLPAGRSDQCWIGVLAALRAN
jgi:hypothetical protein